MLDIKFFVPTFHLSRIKPLLITTPAIILVQAPYADTWFVTGNLLEHLASAPPTKSILQSHRSARFFCAGPDHKYFGIVDYIVSV